MGKQVSATDANRRFFELLREVRIGRSYVVTSHGEPVAKLVPAKYDPRIAAGARASLLARLKLERAVKGNKARRRWTRDELYQDNR